jgi:phage terminase small subunit
MDITAAEDTALKMLYSEFGMTPVARKRVTAGAEKNKGNRFSGFGKPPENDKSRPSPRGKKRGP